MKKNYSLFLSFTFLITSNLSGMSFSNCKGELELMIEKSDAEGITKFLLKNKEKFPVNTSYYRALTSSVIEKRKDEFNKIDKNKVFVGFVELLFGAMTFADLIVNQPENNDQTFTAVGKGALSIVAIGKGLKDIVFNKNERIVKLNRAQAIAQLIEGQAALQYNNSINNA